MRHMSFALTTPQILARTKTVTRRMGWRFLKPGDLLQAIEKGQGLKKGERVRKLAVLRVVSVRFESLAALKPERGGSNGLLPRDPLGLQAIHREIEREGFPRLTPEQFVSMFVKSHKGCTRSTLVTRIAFEYVDQPEASS